MLVRLRLFTMVILALGLMGSLAVAIPASAEDTESPSPPKTAAPIDSDDDGTLDALTTAAAAAGAASEDEPVEDLSQKTETATVLANPDGTLTAKEYATPVRIKRGGDWVDVDYTLVEKADGSWAPKASPVDVSIAGGAAKEAARVEFSNDESLAVTWPTNLPDPTVRGGVATYKLSDATDLVVSTTSTGVNTRIRLNQEPAADDPVFRLGLRAEGVDVDQTNAGGLEVSGDDGKLIAKTSNLVAWDSSTDYAGDPANIVQLDATLDETSTSGDVTQHTLDLTTPDGFLTDSDTLYPVTIDPDISMNKVRDTWTRSGDTANHGAENRLIVGKVDPSITNYSTPARSYLKFYNGTIESNPNIDVVSAEVGLWQYYGYSCTDRRMYAYPVGEAWNDTITYANVPPTVSGGYSTYVDANRGATGCGDGWTTLNVTNMAKAWASGAVDMQGLRLHASTEDASAYERRFCSMNPESGTGCNTATRTPYLSVTYSVPPSTPAGVTVATGGGLPPRISATISDPDGGTVTPHVTIKDGADLVIDVDADPVASGTPWSYTTIPLYDGTFTVTVKASDGALTSASSASQTFTVVAADQGATRVISSAAEAEFISDAAALGTSPMMAKLGIWNADIAENIPVTVTDEQPEPTDVLEDPAADETVDPSGETAEPEPDTQTFISPEYEPDVVPVPPPGTYTPQSAYQKLCPTNYWLYAAKTKKWVENNFGQTLFTVSMSKRWCGNGHRIDSWYTSKPYVTIYKAGSIGGWEDAGKDPEGSDWYTWNGNSRGGHWTKKRQTMKWCPFRVGCLSTKYMHFTIWAHADGSWKWSQSGFGGSGGGYVYQ